MNRQAQKEKRLKRLSQMLRSAAANGKHFSWFSGVRSKDYEFNPAVFKEISDALDEIRALKTEA